MNDIIKTLQERVSLRRYKDLPKWAFPIVV